MGGAHGVGRIDLVENRLVGIKSREIYEAPAAVILHFAHTELERLTLDKPVMNMKDSSWPTNTPTWSITASGSRRCARRWTGLYRRRSGRSSGTVRVKLFKGRRSSPAGNRSTPCITPGSPPTGKKIRSITRPRKASSGSTVSDQDLAPGARGRGERSRRCRGGSRSRRGLEMKAWSGRFKGGLHPEALAFSTSLPRGPAAVRRGHRWEHCPCRDARPAGDHQRRRCGR